MEEETAGGESLAAARRPYQDTRSLEARRDRAGGRAAGGPSPGAGVGRGPVDWARETPFPTEQAVAAI